MIFNWMIYASIVRRILVPFLSLYDWCVTSITELDCLSFWASTVMPLMLHNYAKEFSIIFPLLMFWAFENLTRFDLRGFDVRRVIMTRIECRIGFQSWPVLCAWPSVIYVRRRKTIERRMIKLETLFASLIEIESFMSSFAVHWIQLASWLCHMRLICLLLSLHVSNSKKWMANHESVLSETPSRLLCRIFCKVSHLTPSRRIYSHQEWEKSFPSEVRWRRGFS